MPDTIIYNSNDTAAFNRLSPDQKFLVQQALKEFAPAQQQNDDTNYLALAFFLTPAILGVLVYIISRFIRPSQQPVSTSFTATDNLPEKNEEGYYTYEGANLGLSEQEITSIIVKRYPYYNTLYPTVQYRFQQRLFSFIKAKSFIIFSEEPYKEMPVLASAAAIHLTLGLDDYMLPWFRYIALHEQAYFAKDGLRILAGNVEGEVITLAWSKLLEGINNAADGSNVGLHEMAHALYYQQAVVYENREADFSASFEKVMQEGEEVYKLKDTQHILYSDYAYRDLQEFWAESVEIFFEKPEEMQKCYPRIYDTIKDLLRQDPVNKGNPLC